MKGNWKNIRYLLKKSADEPLTKSESIELENWYESIDFKDVPELTTEEFLHDKNFHEKYEDVLKRAALKNVGPAKRSAKVFILKYRAAAAAILAVLLVSTILWTQFRKVSDPSELTANQNKSIRVEDILPGQEGAVLSLGDGRKIILDDDSETEIPKQGGAVIDNKNGILSYQPQGDVPRNIEYNTLTTPAGRQYMLHLPDGSRVWLNASSSISFPTVFAGDERKVVIKGEAHFEVVKSYTAGGLRKPFKIAVNNSTGSKHNVEIEVLGTSFNVNAYDNESSIKTTLIEGSVKITTGKKIDLLTPSRQSVVSENGNTKILSDINLKQELAWRDDLFYFDHTDIKTILRQFSRWYDVDITIADSAGKRFFSGKISRDLKLVDVLKIMDLSRINYSVEGNKIIINDKPAP